MKPEIECVSQDGKKTGTLTYQEYGSELNSVCDAFKIARANGDAGFAVETKYGWISSHTKPSLRFGKVWECRANGKKYFA